MFSRFASAFSRNGGRAFSVMSGSRGFMLSGAALLSGAAFVCLPNQVANSNANQSAKPSVPPHGKPGTQYERTFIAIKPDGVQRGLIADIIKRFEQKGFTLVAMRL